MALIIFWSIIVILAFVELRKARMLDNRLITKDTARKIYKLMKEDERNEYLNNQIKLDDDVAKEITELLIKLDNL